MKKRLNYSNIIPTWVFQGINFGYPECCVGEFVIHIVKNTLDKREKRKLCGTGFVPCTVCNQKTKKELITIINKNRNPELSSFTGKLK